MNANTKIKWVKHDGNRKLAGFEAEKRDCTVRAVGLLLALPYSEVHADLAKLGRKVQHCFSWPKVVARYGLECMTFSPGCTVGSVLKALPAGRFAVKVRKHVFAVIDGQVWDNQPPKPRQRVQGIYWKPASRNT